MKIDSKSATDPANAVKQIKDQGVNSLRLVISNAGICNDLSPLATADPSVVKEHVDVNGFGALYLFQATIQLMQNTKGAKFVGIGSPLGSIGGMDQRPYPATAYGTSKALQHWIVRKIHYEHPELVSLVVDPGQVSQAFPCSNIPGPMTLQTANCADHLGSYKQIWVTLAQKPSAWRKLLPRQRIASPASLLRYALIPCIRPGSYFYGLTVQKIDAATKEKGSGSFAMWTGETFPW